MSSAVALASHLQCVACGHFSKSHFHLLYHTADAHPHRLDDLAVGRLGNVLIYQGTAGLFHCASCFFTSKAFPRLYEHVVFTHCLGGEGGEEEEEDGEEAVKDQDGQQGDGVGKEERPHAPPRKPGVPSDASDHQREEAEAVARLLRQSKSGFVCLACGYKHRAKRYAISHVMRRHDPSLPYRCSHCSATFLLPSLRRQHALLRHRPGRYGCPYCLFRSSVPHGFKRHCGNCRARGDEEDGEEGAGGDGSDGEEEEEKQQKKKEEAAVVGEEVSVCPSPRIKPVERCGSL